MGTVKMLCYELKCLTSCDVPVFVLSKRIYRWSVQENIMNRRVTHVAHNIYHNVDKVRYFVLYVNTQITSGDYIKSNVVNMDETNMHFDMVGSTTLETRGTRTFNIKSSGTSTHCNLMLAVTMDGQMPPLHNI